MVFIPLSLVLWLAILPIAFYAAGAYLATVWMTELDECGCLTGGYLFVLGVSLVFRLYASAYNRALGSFRLWQHNGNKNSVVVMTTTTEYLLFLPQKMRKIYNLLTFNPVYFIMASLSLPLSLSLLSISVPCTCKYMRTTNFSCISTQRSWGKVMFLHVSVILFTGGGIRVCIAGGIPACLAAGLRGGIPACLAGLQGGGLQAHTQRESWGVWQGGSPGPHPGGSPSPHPGGVYPSMHWGRPPPMDGYCHGW